jgi:hypothetical protein
MGMYLELQAYVKELRRKARLDGCMECWRDVEVGFRGQPTLSEMYRGGSTIEEIDEAAQKRGWYCRKCARKLGVTAATTRRGDFPPGPEGEEEYKKWIMADAFAKGQITWNPYTGERQEIKK